MAAEIISAATGWEDFTRDKLFEVRGRIMNLEHLFREL